MPNNELLGPIFEKEDLIEGFKVTCFVINILFVSFEISGGSYNLSQNNLILINEFEKCMLSFVEILIADFIQFFSVVAKFFFL